MSVLGDVVFSILFFLRAIADALMGRARRRYTTSTVVNAPKNTVWNVVNATDITFDGAIPLTIKMADEPDANGFVSGTISMLDVVMPLTYRLIEVKPGVGTVLEIVPEGTDPAIAIGKDYFVSFVVHDEGQGTRLDIAHELTHKTFLSRVAVPLGAMQNARRIAAHAEKISGRESEGESAIGAAILTGLITFASFFVLWGLDAAALLIATIVIHELGHVIAMRWVGQPVRGIFFIPFLGGVAVASAPHSSEGNRGFVALMGPALSIFTTLAFYMMWQQDTENALLGQLTLISAFLNVINLVPILPLDGGQVMASILSRADPELRRFVSFASLIVSTAIALYFELYLILVLWLLTLPGIFSSKEKRFAVTMAPITTQACVWLTTGYIATIAFYAAIISVFLR